METKPYLTKKPCKNLSPKTSVKNTVLFFIIISFLLPACSKKMSLEEAKEVSISISGKSFVPPPRRIDDITKILDEKPPDSTTVESLQSRADSVPSAGASTVELQEFYYQRGIAAATLGRYKQSLMDLRQAVSLFGDFSSRTPTIHKMIIDSALAEARVNNFRAGIEFAERMRTKFPNWAGVNNLLVSLYALAGDLESAEKARGRALEIMSKWRDSSNNNIWRRYNSGVMKAAILEAGGRYQEAEFLRRIALRLSMTATVKSEYPRPPILCRRWLAINLMAQSRLVEAEVEARQALLDAINTFGSRSLDTRWSVEVLANILSKQGRHGEAERLLVKLISMMKNGGISDDSPVMGWTRYELGNVLIELGDWSGAAKEFRLARVSLEKEPAIFKNRYLLRTAPALAQLRTGDPKNALELLQKAQQTAEQDLGIDHQRTREILGLLAVALFDTGDTARALDNGWPRLLRDISLTDGRKP